MFLTWFLCFLKKCVSSTSVRATTSRPGVALTTYIYIIKQDELLSRGSFVGCMLVKTLLDDVRSQTPSERSTYVLPPADACTYFVPGGGFMVDVTFPFVFVVRSTAPSERIKSIGWPFQTSKKQHTHKMSTQNKNTSTSPTPHTTYTKLPCQPSRPNTSTHWVRRH